MSKLVVIDTGSLWLSILRSWGREGTSGGHGDVGVGVLGLRTESLVESVAGGVRLELGVHVPAELLGRRLRIVILLLWLSLQRFQLLLQDAQVLLVVACRLLSGSCSWVTLGRLLRNRDHYVPKRQERCYFCNDFLAMAESSSDWAKMIHLRFLGLKSKSSFRILPLFSFLTASTQQALI